MKWITSGRIWRLGEDTHRERHTHLTIAVPTDHQHSKLFCLQPIFKQCSQKLNVHSECVTPKIGQIAKRTGTTQKRRSTFICQIAKKKSKQNHQISLSRMAQPGTAFKVAIVSHALHMYDYTADPGQHLTFLCWDTRQKMFVINSALCLTAERNNTKDGTLTGKSVSHWNGQQFLRPIQNEKKYIYTWYHLLLNEAVF